MLYITILCGYVIKSLKTPSIALLTLLVIAFKRRCKSSLWSVETMMGAK